MSARTSAAMERALAALAASPLAPVAEIATLHDVSTPALYRAMKRTNTGERCPSCNRIKPKGKS
jgi:hypothetical protein